MVAEPAFIYRLDMKILLASQAIDGHFNPMTGIGVRLQQEGHEVAWYTGSSMAGRLAELGISHYPFDRAIEHTAEILSVLYPERARLKGPMAIKFDGERIFASNLANFFEDIKATPVRGGCRSRWSSNRRGSAISGN